MTALSISEQHPQAPSPEPPGERQTRRRTAMIAESPTYPIPENRALSPFHLSASYNITNLVFMEPKLRQSRSREYAPFGSDRMSRW